MDEQIFIGLGGNIGDTAQVMRQSLVALEESERVKVVHCSSLYRTTPVSKVEQSDFLNAVVELHSSLPPSGLLGLLLATEQQFGRTRDLFWGPRTLDLDLLFFGDMVENMPGLIVPHPELTRRGFVLAPMAEIAPDFRHPMTGLTMAQHLSEWQESTPGAEHEVQRLTGAAGRLR